MFKNKIFFVDWHFLWSMLSAENVKYRDFFSFSFFSTQRAWTYLVNNGPQIVKWADGHFTVNKHCTAKSVLMCQLTLALPACWHSPLPAAALFNRASALHCWVRLHVSAPGWNTEKDSRVHFVITCFNVLAVLGDSDRDHLAVPPPPGTPLQRS